MAYLITVNVFREDTGQSQAGVPVSLSLSGYNGKTDSNGKVSFSVPEDAGYITVYIYGSTAISGYPYELRNINAFVSSSSFVRLA